jgi:hypothetical protein
VNPELEQALRFQKDDPAKFDQLTPSTKVAAAYYELDKQAAEDERAGTPLPTTTREV